MSEQYCTRCGKEALPGSAFRCPDCGGRTRFSDESENHPDDSDVDCEDQEKENE
jgi:hypothetical protein